LMRVYTFDHHEIDTHTYARPLWYWYTCIR